MSVPSTKTERSDVNAEVVDYGAESSTAEVCDVPSSRLGSALCCVPCLEALNDDDIVVEGNAFDVIVVAGEDHQLFTNSEFLVSFPRTHDTSHRIVLEVQTAATSSAHRTSSKAWFPVIRTDESNRKDARPSYNKEGTWSCCHPSTHSGKIADLNGSLYDEDITSKLAPFLNPGKNPIRYLLLYEQKVIGVAHANIFLWTHADSIVVSDIDGTITKSNARGVIDTILTDNYKHCHEGICSLLTCLAELPNAQALYVSSRPIRFASHTRQFLADLEQGSASLPDGPLLGFGGSISQLLIMELISMTTHHFKADILWRQVVQPFRRVRDPTSTSPLFIAGLGNTIMDVQAYDMAGIDLEKICLIDKKSKISVFDKVDRELVNLSRTNDCLPTPRERKWYKAVMSCGFDGYSDWRLKSRLLPQGHETKDEGCPLAT